MANPNDDSGERVTYPRHFPSAIGFPPPWTHVMSRWLAYFDGYDGTDHMDTIGKMKVEFPVLQLHVMSVDLIERAVKWLNMNTVYNEDFMAGVEKRIAELKKIGVEVPEEAPVETPVESLSTPSTPALFLTDEILFGPGDHVPMTGRLAPDYASSDDGGSTHVEDLSPRQIQIGGEYLDTNLLADISNAREVINVPVSDNSHIVPIPFGGPYDLAEANTNIRPNDSENVRPTIRERRALKHRDEE